MNPQIARSTWIVRALAVTALGAVSLVGCGSDGESGSGPDKGKTPTTKASAGGSGAAQGQEPGEPAQSSGEPVLLLPSSAAAPSGFKLVLAECSPDQPADDTTYTSEIGFAVPQDWTARAKGSGGSGGLSGTNVDLEFKAGDSAEVEVAYDWDSYGVDGVITRDGQPWTTFDYVYQSSEGDSDVTYKEVAKLSVGEQSVELFQRQPSDRFDNRQYKARVLTWNLPGSQVQPSGEDKYSMVVTVEVDDDAADIKQETVEQIISSIYLESCVWDDLLLDEEVIRQFDLNGDDKVKTIQEWTEELQAEMKAKAEN